MPVDLLQHENIKMRLRIVGSSLAAIARELGVTGTTVTSVSQGYRRSRRIESAIAEKLGSSSEALWPARYAQPQKRGDKSVLQDCLRQSSNAAIN